MLSKILLTLSLLLVAGCKSSFPEWPERVQSHFAIVFDEQGPHCYSYKIISKMPYKLGEKIELDPMACQGLSGYLPHEMKDILNYSAEVDYWIKKECK